ncbi:replication-relaxation family protein [Paenibacillus sp. Marseille-Q4541]|uniref:replication-relaxation family protein n=1 Tax=Paenibacillus sp. Marseille-Q4541 TaxID=2831522 RepID=UPI001BAADE11|nr:replication-relaxation family protein [Paenibacillus sp. Marseille-Q4541]
MNRTIAKQTRWTVILSSFETYGYLTTSQVQRLNNLGGRRNTTRILNDMSDFLSSFREGETVFYLNANGRKEIGSEKPQLRRTQHVGHTIMRNDVLIALQPEYWRPEYTVKWDNHAIQADALLRTKNAYTFLEVDITQSTAQNQRKIDMYRALKDTGRWEKKHGNFPAILFVTVSEYRRDRLRAILDKAGLESQVLTRDDLK